ncbi:hypothetical protein [Streptomyces sp. NPDC058084]|uniref:hypothetical protein n=1 Tax=Streptomyces sp. NPDC058084 TaxID=3346333 RepID=UPI0036EC01A0
MPGPSIQPAPYGHGLSRYDNGTLLHTLAADWTITLHPGTPDSLWDEYRTDRWYPTAPSRCRRVATWKAPVAHSGAGGTRPCPACQLTDAERALLDTRIGPPHTTETGHLR